MKALYGISLFCGLAPLMAGITIYVLWLLTGREVFVLAGIYTIYVGLALVTLGFVCLVVYLYKLTRRGVRGKPVIKRAVIGTSVLLVNLPVCLLIVVLAFTDLTEFTVLVKNESHVTISQFKLSGPGVDEQWENIGPGELFESPIRFTHDGTLTYSAWIDSFQYRGVVAGYVTNGLGGWAEVIVRRDTVIVETGL